MKKLILLSAFAFASILSAKAQHVMSAINNPTAGSTDIQEQDTVPSVTPGSAGSNQVWDLSSIQSRNSLSTQYVSPSTTAKASKFPTANVALNSGNQTTYYTSDVNGFTGVGAIFTIPNDTNLIILKGHPNEKIFKYPSAFQSSFHDSSVFSGSAYYGKSYNGQQIDSVRVTNTTVSDTQYDGYGKVTTPNNTFNNALREKKYSKNTTKIEVYIKFGQFDIWQPFSNKKTKSNTYSWYTDNQFAVASITETIDSNNVAKVTLAQYFNGVTGIASLNNKNIKISTYPNPAINEVNFVFNDASAISLDVYNVIGEKMETLVFSNSSNVKLNTSAYATGLYI
jgi:hypothetical protein